MGGTIGIRFGVEGEKELKAAIRDIDSSLKVLGSEMKLLSTEYGKNDKSVEALTARNKILNKEAEEQAKKVNLLGEHLEKVKEKYGENSREAQHWQVQLNNARGQLNNLNNEINQNEQELEGLGNEMEDAGEKSSVFGDVLKAALTAEAIKAGIEMLVNGFKAIGTGIKDCVSIVATFEDSMLQVAATMGMSTEEIRGGSEAYKLLEKAAKDAGANTRYSASQAADALNYLALAGYDAVQAADALPSILTLAAAGGLDLAYASDLATDAMGALGIVANQSNLTEFGDKMAKAAQKSNTNVAQLGEAILKVGGTAKSLAGGTDELNTALGMFANVGIKGSEGGTALRNIILAMTPTTSDAAAAFEYLGLKSYDADGNLRPLNETFKDLNKSMSVMTTEEKNGVLNTIFNKVDLKSVSALLAACASSTDELGSAFLAAGVPAEKLDKFLNNFNDSMYNTMTETEFAASVVKDFGISADEAGTVYSAFATQLNGISWENLYNEISDCGGAMQMMADTMESGLAGAERSWNSAVEGMQIEIGSLFALLKQDFLSEATESIRTFTQGLQAAEGDWTKIGESADRLFSDFTDIILNTIPTIVPIAADLVATIIKTIVMKAPDIILAGEDIVRNIAVGLGQSLPLFKPIADAISGIITVLKNLTPYLIAATAALTAFQIAATIADMLKGMTIATTIHTVAQNIWTAATTAAAAAQTLLNAAWAANPIGLVVAGVAALAAGITALVVLLNRETDEAKKLRESTEKLIEENNNLNKSIDDTKAAYEEKTKSVEQDAGAAKNLADKISELSSIENKSAQQKQELVTFCDMLNEAMGENIVQYDEETDTLSENINAIYSRIDAMQEEAKAQAARERAVEIAKEQMAVEEQLNKINQQRIKLDKALADGTVKKKAYNKEIENLNNSETELVSTQEDLTASFTNATKTATEAAERQAAANKIIADSTNTTTKEMQEAYATQEELAQKKIEKEQEVTDAMILSASQQGLTLEEYKENLKDYEESVKEQQENVEKIFGDTEKSLEGYLNSATDMFKKLSVDSSLSVSEATKNLEYNQKVVEELTDNLVKLAERGIDEGLLASLQNAGESSAGFVANIVKSSDKEFEKLNDTFKNGAEVATAALLKELGIPDVINSGKDMVDDIADGVKENKDLETAADKLIKDAKDAAAIAVETGNFDEVGAAIVEGTWAGIAKNEASFRAQITTMFENIVKDVNKTLEINSPSKVFARIGGSMVEGLNVGFTREMKSAAKDITNAIPTKFDITPEINAMKYSVADWSTPKALTVEAVESHPVIVSLSEKFDSLGKMFGSLISLVEKKILPAMDKNIVLDTGTLVGSTASPMDIAMANRTLMAVRS